MRAPRSSKPRRDLRVRPLLLLLEGRQLLNADVLTYHDDNARTSADLQESTLTPSNVNATDFGKVGFLNVDGKVDAQPLYVSDVSIPGQGTHDVVYVATENDSLYAFDANSGSILWHDGPNIGAQALLNSDESAVPASDFNCNQVAPLIGITATPVIDPASNTIYVVTDSKAVVNGSPVYSQRIHALDITTGVNKVAPTSIDASIGFPGSGPGGNGSDVIFDPAQYVERDALTLSNGVVYTGWSSHCDSPAYTGWVIGFNASNLGLATVLNIDPNGTPAATDNAGGSGNTFWNSGGGFAVDGQGNLFNISANGPFDISKGDYGDSILRFSTANGLAVSGYFTPYNQQALSDADTDLGSSGIVLLPNVEDASGQPVALAIGSGKDGNIYVVDRTNLGGFNASSNQIVQELTGVLGGPLFGSPAYFNNQVYFGAVGSTLKAFSVVDGKLTTTPTSESTESFVYPGTSPTISANGSSNGIVWASSNDSTAALYAYNASNLGAELYNSNQAANGRDQFGAGNKFITPMVADGKVYVGTTDGVAVFGLLASPPTVAIPAFSSTNPLVGGLDFLAAAGASSTFGQPGLTYTWSTLTAPTGAPSPSFSVNGTNASYLVSVGIAQAGGYTFQVSIADPDGQTVTSDVTLNANLPVPLVVIPAFSSPMPIVGGLDLLAVGGSDQAFNPSTLTYTWSALSTPVGASKPTFSANNGTNASSLVAAQFAKAGTYVIQVAITNPFDEVATSDLTVVVGPAKVTRPTRKK